MWNRPISEPTDSQEFYRRAVAHLRSGNARMSIEVCEKSLRSFPGDANILCLAAKANLALRQFGESQARAEEAIRLFPDFSTAHETLGDSLLVQGRARAARKAYEQAMRLDPARSVTHDKIDRARKLEQQAALAGAKSSTELAPRPRMAFAAEIGRAIELDRDGDGQGAETIYRDVLKKDPDHVEAARLLAGIAAGRKRFRDAEVFLLRVVSNAPDYARAWVDIANVQRELNKFDAAIDSATQALRLAPEKAESHMLFASAIGMVGRHEEAVEVCKDALELSPDKASVYCIMAHHLKTIGRQDDAVAAYRRSIAAKADHAEAYWSLANLKTFRFTEDEVQAMKSLLEDAELPDESRTQIHNALGLEYESRKDYASAFSNFEQGNILRRKAESYDPVDIESTYDRIIDMFDEKIFLQNAGVQPSKTTPIFVVGLPRSGSTLIEQILASHSQVEGTHELGDLQQVVQSARRKKRQRERFPESLAGFGADEWLAIGEEYLERTRIFRSDLPFFVDKNPNNFIYAGILKLAIPNAKIINAKRHPLDSCLGSYKQLFASGQPFSYDLTELGEYYVQYSRLIDHWHTVLPDFVLDVHYEEVVADLEPQVRRILDFCNLPFEEECLRFYETERAVKTASSEQVRQPIYSSSVNLWRNYEPFLETLVHILTPRLQGRPAEDRPATLVQSTEKYSQEVDK
ncbi:MAG: hypothetical protein DRR11_05480 [Gammaproteobacteria bacterium]|nr:MAG: hypothetical protein DRR11_05480 [Gammaproteobacteria bacterium]